MSLFTHEVASGGAPLGHPPATPRSRSLGQTTEDRQRFVARVLDLLQLAEAGLQVPNDPQAVSAAIRAISAVKAISAFLSHQLIAHEAALIIEYSERMGLLGDSDRSWLLAAIDRLRLLAVDPHHSSTPMSLMISVAMAHIDRLNTVVVELTTRLAEHPDPHVMALLGELRASSKLLLRAPVAPLVSRLQAHALRFSHVLATRGDDLAIEPQLLHLLEIIAPPLVTAAASESSCEHQLTLLLVEHERELVVRLACGCVVQVPALVTDTLKNAGVLVQDDGIITIRISF